MNGEPKDDRVINGEDQHGCSERDSVASGNGFPLKIRESLNQDDARRKGKRGLTKTPVDSFDKDRADFDQVQQEA